MDKIKKFARLSVYCAYLFVAVFALLEIIFRILPVSDAIETMPVNKDNPIYHFRPNRNVTRQIGFHFRHVTKKHINNFGYATDTDFTSDAPLQGIRVTVIGDSYVEAMQVDNQNTFHALIGHNNLTVYPIGVSGAPLSQYLAFAEYAKELFDPDVYVFLLIGNDFDESWQHVKNAPGFHYFTHTGELELVAYQPTLLEIIAKKSAFLRYLVIDLKIQVQLQRFFNRTQATTSKTNERVINNELLGYKAADMFLHKLEEMAKDKAIIVMVDGDRHAIYQHQDERRDDFLPNRWFKKVVRSLENHDTITLLDLHPYFVADWKVNHTMFNFEYDYHWNEHGHSVVARALADSLHKFVH